LSKPSRMMANSARTLSSRLFRLVNKNPFPNTLLHRNPYSHDCGSPNISTTDTSIVGDACVLKILSNKRINAPRIQCIPIRSMQTIETSLNNRQKEIPLTKLICTRTHPKKRTINGRIPMLKMRVFLGSRKSAYVPQV